jgi:hypothetical protein
MDSFTVKKLVEEELARGGSFAKIILFSRVIVSLKEIASLFRLRSFDIAERILQGIEAMHIIRKRLVKRLNRNDAHSQAKFVVSLFQITA